MIIKIINVLALLINFHLCELKVEADSELIRIKAVHTIGVPEKPKLAADTILQKLVNASYDHRVRPPSKTGVLGPVDINVNMYLRSVSNIDFVNMQFNLQLTFRETWVDPRLSYSYVGENVPGYIIITKSNMIWMPDTFFQNEKQAHRHVIDTPNMLIRVYPDGSVLYSERISLVLSCPMYLKKYPMDVQTCLMDLASYAYTTEDIVYTWKEVDPIQYHPALKDSLPSFHLSQVGTDTCTSRTNTGTYSCLRTIFKLERQFSYYLLQVYIPSTLLVIVSWVSFWLDRAAVPARVTLGVTTLLSMTTQAASINQKLPPVSYIKAIDIWIAVCLSFIFAAVLEYAYVSFLASILEQKKKTNCEAHGTPCTADTPDKVQSPDVTEVVPMQEAQKLLNHDHSKKLSPRRWSPIAFWHGMTAGADEAKMIDVNSRVAFPILYALFNVFYWSWYALD